ncbi:response regulator, partial [bacterium]|nr:response regulator [bacterium]
AYYYLFQLHIILCLFLILFLVFIYSSKYFIVLKKNIFLKFVQNFYVLFMLFWGGTVTILDQSLHENLIVFALVAFGSSVLIILEVWSSFWFYLSSLIYVLLGISYFQNDIDKLRGIYINLSILAVVSWIVSRIMSQFMLKNYNFIKEIQYKTYELSEAGFWDYNIEKNTIFFSNAWKKMLGYEEDELPNSLEEWERRLHPADKERVFSEREKYFNYSEKYQDLEYRMICKNEDYIWILDRAKVIKTDQFGKPLRIIGVHTDITKLKNYQKNLELSQKEIQQANHFKTQFLSNVTHELRTPLNGIIGFTEILAESEENQAKKDMLNMVYHSSETLLEIINDILDFSKLESGKLILEKQPFLIEEVILRLQKRYQIVSELKHIEFKIEINEENSKIPNFIGDPLRLEQILNNLLSNAFKFTKEGMVSLIIYFDKIKNNQYNVIFQVHDTGIGIFGDKLDFIFECFTQEEDYITRKYGGVGLGLAIVKHLTKQMNGKIEVQSEASIGSIFTVKIPFEVEVSKIDFEISTISFNQKDNIYRILLAEDNKNNQILVEEIFSLVNIGVDIANNGIEVFEKYYQKEYDLILMDIQMPQMNGLEATKAIRVFEKENNRKQIPIIALSAHSLPHEQKEAIDSGMDDFITKPFNKKTLLDKIFEFLNKK